MNKEMLQKMEDAQETEKSRIKSLECYQKVSNEFKTEYQIAKELLKARNSASLTQKEIAESMGTTQSVISRIEHGYNVSLNTIEKYAVACGKHIEFHLV